MAIKDTAKFYEENKYCVIREFIPPILADYLYGYAQMRANRAKTMVNSNWPGYREDIDGTYTGVAQLTSEERANYFQCSDIDRLSDRGITALQPAKKSIKQQSLRATQAIQQVVKKPQITVKSETIKKDGSY